MAEIDLHLSRSSSSHLNTSQVRFFGILVPETYSLMMIWKKRLTLALVLEVLLLALDLDKLALERRLDEIEVGLLAHELGLLLLEVRNDAIELALVLIQVVIVRLQLAQVVAQLGLLGLHVAQLDLELRVEYLGASERIRRHALVLQDDVALEARAIERLLGVGELLLERRDLHLELLDGLVAALVLLHLPHLVLDDVVLLVLELVAIPLQLVVGRLQLVALDAQRLGLRGHGDARLLQIRLLVDGRLELLLAEVALAARLVRHALGALRLQAVVVDARLELAALGVALVQLLLAGEQRVAAHVQLALQVVDLQLTFADRRLHGDKRRVGEWRARAAASTTATSFHR